MRRAATVREAIEHVAQGRWLGAAAPARQERILGFQVLLADPAVHRSTSQPDRLSSVLIRRLAA